MERMHLKLTEKNLNALKIYTISLGVHALDGTNGSVKEVHLSAIVQDTMDPDHNSLRFFQLANSKDIDLAIINLALTNVFANLHID